MSFAMNNTTAAAHILQIHLPSLRILIGMTCIVLYLFGYTGCLLSIITFSSKKLRCHSTGFLFLLMAFVDMFNLVASLQYFLNGIYQIDVFALSIHWCRLFTICNYELYFGFSWIFAFISLDRWLKVEWPTRSQTWCTRQRFIYLCLIGLILSLVQNIVHAFVCLNDRCAPKNLACEVSINVTYIMIYMVVPIAIILVSISRTCLITLHIKKRFRTSAQQQLLAANLLKSCQGNRQSSAGSNINSVALTSRTSSSYVSSSSRPTTKITKHQQNNHSLQRSANSSMKFRRRRTGLDRQMILLISINVVPFILVHIITEIAYLFEKYSSYVADSKGASLVIMLIYLSWYLISATRFYTNCLLSRIYREEFLNRLAMLRNGCKPRIVLVGEGQSPRHSSKLQIRRITNGLETTVLSASNVRSCSMI